MRDSSGFFCYSLSLFVSITKLYFYVTSATLGMLILFGGQLHSKCNRKDIRKPLFKYINK